VDDVFYFVETPFRMARPDRRTETAERSSSRERRDSGGALYFSSAGNSGNLKTDSGVWEGDFVTVGVSLPVPGPVASTASGDAL